MGIGITTSLQDAIIDFKQRLMYLRYNPFEKPLKCVKINII